MQLPSDIENTVSVLTMRYGKTTYWIYYVILLFFVVVLITIPFVSVDITSQNRGVVRSMYDNVDIQSIVNGKVLYENIVNNSKIEKGDTILILESCSIMEQINSQQVMLMDIKKRLCDLNILTSGSFKNGILETHLYKGEWSDYMIRQKNLKLKIKQSKRECIRANEGRKIGLVSEYEYNKNKDAYESFVSELKNIESQQMTSWENDKQQLEEQMITINGEINRLQSELSNYILISPINGTVVSNSQIQVNSYLLAGQNIATITPEENLIVECYVEPTNVGFIKEGQKVSLQFDAFNYNQWGFGKAIVYDIDKNVTIQGDNTYFIVRCKITNSTLSLKNGYKVEIKKGMTLNGRFFVTRRTLWQLLFDKMDDWFNPKMN